MHWREQYDGEMEGYGSLYEKEIIDLLYKKAEHG